MKLTFCVTFYNQEKYVCRCLDSIIEQTIFYDSEILIVDDGSTDNTCILIEEYIKKYPDQIKLYKIPRVPNVKYETRSRLGENRLGMVEKASGEYFCMVDGDDYYCDRNFAEEGVRILDEQKECSICAFDYFLEFPDGKKEFPPLERLKSGMITARDYITKCYIHIAACVLRNCMQEKDFNLIREDKWYSDVGIFRYHLNFGNIYRVQRYVYSYTQSNTSVWNELTQMEKYAVSAADFSIELKRLPRFKKEIYKTDFPCVVQVFKMRNNLNQLKHLDNYLNVTSRIKNNMVYIIFNWKNETLFRKIPVFFTVLLYAFREKMYLDIFIQKIKYFMPKKFKVFIKRIFFSKKK